MLSIYVLLNLVHFTLMFVSAYVLILKRLFHTWYVLVWLCGSHILVVVIVQICIMFM